MHLFIQAAGVLGKLVVVVVINLSLFLVIPVTEGMFSLIGGMKEERVETRKKLVAEYIKPKQKEVKRTQQSRVRSVSNASARPMQSSMKFKFTPDLSVGGAGEGVAMQSQQLEAEVFEEGQVDVDPVPMQTPPPAYPDRARDLAVEGEAVAVFVVDVDGKVRTIENIDAPHPIIADEIRATIMQWKFKPAQNRGVPVKARMRVPFDFSLDS